MTESFDLAPLVSFAITALISLVTGAAGAQLIAGMFASKRGVKGDELKREENSTARFNAIFAAQDVMINKQGKQVETLMEQVGSLKSEMTGIQRQLMAGENYTRRLIALLDEHTIEPPPRD
jgi:hypothetical protein